MNIEFVRIEPGEFMMGSDKGLPLEQPVHLVSIEQPFLIGAHPITQRVWESVMSSNPSTFKSAPDLPVESVSWDDAMLFCEKASRVLGKDVRLPSEAEWEYACRAGGECEFHFGDESGPLDDFAWFSLNSLEMPHSVGLKQPNAWGLFDMVGNVWEWCADVWHSDYDGAPSDDSAWMSGEQNQPRRVLRGAAWDMDAFRCRSAYRSKESKELGTSRFGLRVAVSI